MRGQLIYLRLRNASSPKLRRGLSSVEKKKVSSKDEYNCESVHIKIFRSVRSPSPTPSYQTLRPSSPAPRYRATEPSSHDTGPSQTQGINIAPHHVTIVNEIAGELRSDINREALAISRLHLLLSAGRTVENSLRGLLWDGEVQVPSSQKEFDEIVDSTRVLLVREVLDSPEMKKCMRKPHRDGH